MIGIFSIRHRPRPLLTACALALLGAFMFVTAGNAKPAKVARLRLYIMDCGTIVPMDPALYGLKAEEIHGDTGFVNPRGDRLLTTLSLWALRELKPKLMMINYQDPDYVHWGPRQFYTRAISIIDEGVRELYSAVQADEEYRNRTVFIIVPDCGRDSNRAMPVPYQHHFGSRSAHEIFAVIAGPSGIIGRAAAPVDRVQQQIYVAKTIGQLMDFETPQANNRSLLA